jgi:hypothetical protein
LFQSVGAHFALFACRLEAKLRWIVTTILKSFAHRKRNPQNFSAPSGRGILLLLHLPIRNSSTLTVYFQSGIRIGSYFCADCLQPILVKGKKLGKCSHCEAFFAEAIC